MKILVIDDSEDTHIILTRYLNKAGYQDVKCVFSGLDALNELQLDKFKDLEKQKTRKPDELQCHYDLILLDIKMDEMDGIQTCKKIREANCFKDVPIIVITVDHSGKSLQEAFNAGANDYITKPIRKIELIARINSAMRLKKEMDTRKKTARDLVIANQVLQSLYTTDPLTNIHNRRHFNILYENEWKRARREKSFISLIMLDVDYFKAYNDTYGHLSGDNCLIQIANCITQCLKRPADFTARYGGEEFVIVLPYTELEGGIGLAENIRKTVNALKIEHRSSKAVPYLSVSCGVASMIPSIDVLPEKLISMADIALYKAKNSGRNCVKAFKSWMEPNNTGRKK